MAAADYYTQVYTMFVGYFGRPPAQSGLDYYANLVNAAGGKLNAVLDDFHKAPESQALFAGKSVEQQVNIIFQNLFGRDALPAGLNYWAGEIVAGRLALSQAAYAIAQGAQTADKAVLTAKVDSAKAWVAGLDTTTEILTFSTDAGRAAGRDFLKAVTTGTPATQTAVDAALKAMVDGGNVNPGQTYTLTSSVDNVAGTTGNDTILAGTQAGAATLTAGDQINGGAGTDTLKIYAGSVNFAAATISNVEIVELYENASLSVAANTGVKQVWDIGGAGQTTTANVGQIIGYGNQSTGGTAVATFVNVAGTADAATIGVKNAGKTAAYTGITVAGIESLTIQAEGTNKLGTLTAAATDTLTVTGSGSVTATAAGGTFKVVDASANTGGLALDISALAAADLKVTGGSGNDEITVDYANLTKADVINLGGGTADVLGFSVSGVTFNSAATASLLAGVSGVESLKVNGAITATIDAALVSQSNFNIASTGLATLTNLANADTVTYSAATKVGNTIGLELGQNTLNLTLAGGAAAASGTTTVTGSSVVNIASSGKAGVAGNTLTLTTPDNNLFNVTGSQDLTLAVTGAGAVTGQTVNGSAFTGKLTVTTTALADIVKGGSGADTITGGKGADILTGNGGADIFSFVGTAGQTQSGATFGQFDTITDFVVGTDKLQFTGVADVISGQQAAVQAAVSALAAGSSATAIATAMAGANTTNLGVSFAVFEGNTYVLYETSGVGAGVAADDVFIKLTGVTTAPTFAADVVA